MARDRLGRYAYKQDAAALVIGAGLLLTLFLVLNHFNAARLDTVNARNCAVYGMQPDCRTALDAAN